MSVISSPALFMGEDGYQISRSVRLRSSATAYFNRTPGSATNRTTWTWSGWVKRSNLGAWGAMFSSGTLGGSSSFEYITFRSDDSLQWVTYTTSTQANLITTQVFRDPSAWYHIVVAFDSTQATSTNRVKMYVNGTQITSFSTSSYPSLNYSSFINNNQIHSIGRDNGGDYLDGYLTEVNFIDGQALTPSSFGENDSITGVWKPKKYAGTYGTNGFYLNFSDNSNNTAATIGKDYSGNGNNWTPNNISVTSGVTYDSMIDTPTPYADGGTGRGNYCTLNPLDQTSMSSVSAANLQGNASGSTSAAVRGTIAVTSGKWYWEATAGTYTTSPTFMIGVADSSVAITSANWGTANAWCYYGSNGQKYTSGSGTSYGATYTTGNVIGIALDMDNGTLTFYKDGVSQGQAYSGLTGKSLTPTMGTGLYALTFDFNFGQRPFAYTPPTGFKALNTQNLSTPTIMNGAQYMAATTYTGNGSTQSITNGGNNTIGTTFKPDFVWIKGRDYADFHTLFDTVRGATQSLSSNLTTAEVTRSTALTAFTSTGFTVGSDTLVNYNGHPTVAWQWQAGQGTTSSNTSGSITSTVSVNATAGFSVVTYTGNNSTATIGHGLGVAPSMIIIKDRNQGVGYNWNVYHASLGNTQRIFLDSTSASIAGVWNSTSPTSTVFTVTNNVAVNGTDTYVAYCWAAVPGYSAFGSYTGNGSADGPFVYCGFRPRWLMLKITSAADSWYMFDTSRDSINVMSAFLAANSSSAEGSVAALDVTANGFKLRSTNTAFNASGGTYIFAAFAENPFKYALAR